MNELKEVGEITAKNGEFLKWIIENLENTDYFITQNLTTGFNTSIKVYKKLETDNEE